MISLGIVDDDPMVRTGLKLILGGDADLSVAWEAGDGAVALERLAETPVDLLLLDIRMPVLDGLATLAALQELPQRPRVIVLTTFNTDDYVVRALKAGANGFLLKDADPARLIEAIRRVAAGEPSLSPEVTATLIAAATAAPQADSAAQQALAGLTEREREVLAEVARGANNQEISERLYMAEGTVKTHIGRLLSKLGARDRVGLVLIALQEGLGD